MEIFLGGDAEICPGGDADARLRGSGSGHL